LKEDVEKVLKKWRALGRKKEIKHWASIRGSVFVGVNSLVGNLLGKTQRIKNDGNTWEKRLGRSFLKLGELLKGEEKNLGEKICNRIFIEGPIKGGCRLWVQPDRQLRTEIRG